ncbi:ATP-binding protein [Amaricoccus macauensis]|uniref:ATP-binding protein n=1 Tax=Amaricoccus macauensis TaxID=57001 RepID=UPI003C7C8EA0
MKNLAKKVLPDGLAGRFALVLIFALLTVNLVGLGLLSLERSRFDREVQRTRAFDQIVSLVPPLEAIDPDARRGLAEDASGRLSRITIGPAPQVAVSGRDAESRALEEAFRDALPGREIRVLALRDERDRRREQRDGEGRSEPRLGSVSISVRLEIDGPEQWLNARSRVFRPMPPRQPSRSVLTVPILSLVVVLATGLIFVRRLTRPLARLAEATRAAGHGDRTVRVPEDGARELRAAAAAFNDMQERIARFDAERMRTLAAVGHDLRTPITSLRIRAEMLDEAEAEPMIRTLDEMTVMADGLVAYAKGAGAAEDVQDIDLETFLRQICEDLQADLGVTRPASVSARPVALRRAIGNLIDNARRYGGSAQVTLQRDQKSAIIEVADTGPGIPEERIEAMFDPFVRGDDSRSVETGGAGLGLSIARNIILAQAGTITLENRETGGLRAVVRLPLKGHPDPGP